VGIEGPIGCGKSIAGKTVADILGYRFYPEPIADAIERLRKKFYADMEKYAGLFQYKIFLKRFCQHQRIILDLAMEGAIQDRTIYGDKPFAYMLHESGKIDDEQLEVYEELWQSYRHFLVYPDLIFFLEADIPVLMKRIHGERKREEESGITPEYLEALNDKIHLLYEDMIANGVICFKLDWNDPNTNISTMVHLIKQTAKRKPSLWGRVR
jgi:deoxyadenosine/deoxycytidine kinase